MANTQAQASVNNLPNNLSASDKASVANLRNVIATAPKGRDIEKQFRWEDAKRVPARETTVPEGLNKAAGKLPEGIEIPSRKKGDASILLVPSGQIAAGYTNLIFRVNVIPEPPKEANKSTIDSYNRQFEAPENAKRGYLFPPLKPFSQENANTLLVSSFRQLLCGSNSEKEFFVTKKNGTLGCSLSRLDYLDSVGFTNKRDKKEVLTYLATALPPSNWAVEVVSAFNGKFDNKTREVLPGGELFKSAIEARVARIKYEAEQDEKTGKPKNPATEKSIAAQLQLNEKSSGNSLLGALRNTVEIQASREFDDLSKRSGRGMINKESYVKNRMAEFDSYLDGKSESFKLKKFYPTPLNIK